MRISSRCENIKNLKRNVVNVFVLVLVVHSFCVRSKTRKQNKESALNINLDDFLPSLNRKTLEHLNEIEK